MPGSLLSRRDFARSAALLSFAAVVSACASNTSGADDASLTHDQATLAVLKRSMYEAERLLFYLAFAEDLPLDTWREVFDRAVRRVEGGVDVWDEQLWKRDITDKSKSQSDDVERFRHKYEEVS